MADKILMDAWNATVETWHAEAIEVLGSDEDIIEVLEANATIDLDDLRAWNWWVHAMLNGLV